MTDVQPDEVEIVHNADASRYELYVGAELASLADYNARGDVVVMHHTETRPMFSGRGYAAQVVRFALDDLRKGRRSIIPQCWFVADFIDAHPEYKDLLAA
jgi:uncharacterized protein